MMPRRISVFNIEMAKETANPKNYCWVHGNPENSYSLILWIVSYLKILDLLSFSEVSILPAEQQYFVYKLAKKK